MSFLKTRGGAVLVFIVVIILSTMFGVNRSLGDQVRKIEGACFTDKYVLYDVDARIDSGLNLLTVADRYPELNTQAGLLREARNALIDAWENKTGAAAVTASNRALTAAAATLYQAMQAVSLSETDAENAEKDYARMISAGQALVQTEYNQSAQAFNSGTMRAFPTNYLKYAGFVEEAALF